MGNTSGTVRLICQRPDGGISVDAPIERIANDPVQLAAHIARLEANGFTILKADATGADLPSERAGQSRKFRNAWRWDGAKIEPDLPLCREQVMAEVRAERDTRLAATDGEAVRNQERGQPDQALKNHRQALRDFPTTVQAAVDALADAAALEAYAPAWPVRA